MANTGIKADYTEFRDEFFPSPPSEGFKAKLRGKAKPTFFFNPFSKLAKADAMTEAELSAEFCKVVNSKKLAPGLTLALSENRPDPVSVDEKKQKIDAAFFRDERTPKDGRPHWADQLVAVEFKRGDNNLDPFDDSKKKEFDSNAITRKDVRGQIISYAELIFAVQQRVALFMIVIIGRRCRFIRWDRSGTIVTKLLDYVTEWRTFHDMLWRMSLLSDEALGMDPSATRLWSGSGLFDDMDKVARECNTDIDHHERDLEDGELHDGSVFEYVRTMFRNSLVEDWPRYCLSVPNGEETRNFLVCKPVFRAKGMAGRGTRGYVAYDCGEKRFVWLKDAWRAHYLLLEKEGDVLAELNAAEVRFIPTLVCHGDILDQTTLTPTWWERKNADRLATLPPPVAPNQAVASSLRTLVSPSTSDALKRKRRDNDDDNSPLPKGLRNDDGSASRGCPLRRHKHYRLVVEEVGMALSEFQFGRQLIAILYDCLCAHQEATTKANRLHRDVSGGNVLIYPRQVKNTNNGVTVLQWSGLLADWELSKRTDTPRKARQPERTGTWQFMSVAMLSPGDPKQVEVCDEVESFLHVLVYYAARYLHSNCDDLTIATYIDAYFDAYSVDDGSYVCGQTKLNAIKNGELSISPGKLLEFDSPMDDLTKTLLSWFKALSKVREHRRRQTIAKGLLLSTPKPKIHAGPQLRPYVFDSSPSNSILTAPVEPRKKPIAITEPSAEETIDAAKVLTHSEMLQQLKNAIADMGWTLDKVGDRVPAGWKSPNTYGPPAMSSLAVSNKRPKKSGGHISMPGLPEH